METTNEMVYTALHPSRLEILLELSKKASYASKLEETLEINRKVVTFHLAVLQKHGLIEGEFGLKNDPEVKPVAVKYFRLTTKGEAVLLKIGRLKS